MIQCDGKYQVFMKRFKLLLLMEVDMRKIYWMDNNCFRHISTFKNCCGSLMYFVIACGTDLLRNPLLFLENKMDNMILNFVHVNIYKTHTHTHTHKWP